MYDDQKQHRHCFPFGTKAFTELFHSIVLFSLGGDDG